MTDDPMESELWRAYIAKPRDSARYVAAMEDAVLLRLIEPEVDRHPDLVELYLRLITEYQVLGRWDDALTAADAVVDEGPDMNPDPRCLRAHILMRMGRVAEAEQIWTAVRADTPDDVWLYNAAGMAYAGVGDHHSALDWLTEGVRVGLRIEGPDTEDPMTDELAELRQQSLDALGLQPDALQEQVMTFLRDLREKERFDTLSQWGAKPGERPIRPKKRAQRPSISEQQNTDAQRTPSLWARVGARVRKVLHTRHWG